ncbi:hypothetical protein HG1285_11902, partial [Hydrogenivirga sp. 128-5-R1-1]
MNKKLIDTLTPNFNILVEKNEPFLEEVNKYLQDLLEINHKIHYIDQIDKKYLEEYFLASDLFIVYKKTNKDLLNRALENFLPILFIDTEDLPSFYALHIKDEPPQKIAAIIALLADNRRLRRKIIQHQIEKTNIRPEIIYQIEGSFDSSYSLAIVNREISRALNKKHPDKVALYSTDGYGDFDPDKEFLEENPDIKHMYQKSKKAYHAPVVLRNPYPPRVYDMKGHINAMTSYGWEESEYPKEYLEDFNKYLDILPIMSPYVEKVMIDNGIKIPVKTVGIGVDHILK